MIKKQQHSSLEAVREVVVVSHYVAVQLSSSPRAKETNYVRLCISAISIIWYYGTCLTGRLGLTLPLAG